MSCDFDGQTVLAGIATFGPDFCGWMSMPGVFTNIAAHSSWLLYNAGLTTQAPPPTTQQPMREKKNTTLYSGTLCIYLNSTLKNKYFSADDCREANKHLLNLINDEETQDVEGWDINIAFGKFMGPSEQFWEQCNGNKGKWYGYSPNVMGDEAFIRTTLYGHGNLNFTFGNCGNNHGDI